MILRLKQSLALLPLLCLLWMAAPQPVQAQCPMCKAAVESSSEKGGGKGSFLVRNLNTGIIYLFVLPYAAIMLIGVVWYRHYRLRKREEAREKMVTLESVAGMEMPGSSPSE